MRVIFASVYEPPRFLLASTSAAVLACAGRVVGRRRGRSRLSRDRSPTAAGSHQHSPNATRRSARDNGVALRTSGPAIRGRGGLQRGIRATSADLRAMGRRHDRCAGHLNLAGVTLLAQAQLRIQRTTVIREKLPGVLIMARAALPNVTLVVLEPFVLRTGAVDAGWFPEFDERRAAAARVATAVGARFVPLQAVFDARAAESGPETWAKDGVHPTPAGHAVIAQQWRAVVGL